ncbi:HlyD family type I secretion periplasmic adaptor subunit [Parasulfuritortus cantonensis]|uniref:Membrane fusion protein (MFP) family protein n=2 Tax=Parasulfuritortus cantonensis TaxID=2528202 RepID=A0A4R1BAF9_9PROT|nr:HlyD family type I secretion periplasmic adaptor subunit [Parasulfuritortus cantonensis]
MDRPRNGLDRLLSRWIPKENKEELDWVSDADWARIQQEPLRARFVLRWFGIILAVLLLWAAFAPIDEITRGQAKVIPSRQLQVMQAVDGGVVSEINVREGQVVEAGQQLLKIDPTRFVSSLGENRAQYLAYLAKAARLKAISDGTSFVVPPEVAKEAPDLAEQERSLYLSRRSELDAQIAIARQQLAQRNQELVEVKARRDQAAQAYDLTAKELSVTKPLAGSGAVSEVELLRLQRDLGRFQGDRDQAAAQISRIQSAIAEAQRKIQEVDLNFRNQARIDLADTTAKINSLSESSTALSDRVKHSSVRSPVKGTVKRLLVNTVGGVVQPGADIVEVVPLEDVLLLEVKILPRDIAFLRPGLKATVRFTAYDFSIYGSMDAVVDQIGADTITDDKGNSFYIVRVHTLKSSLGKNLPILPGMVAEVDIMTGKKTVLSYLLKPILRAHAHALTER